MSLPISFIDSFIIQAPAQVRQKGERLLEQLETTKNSAYWAQISVEKEGPRSRVLAVPSQNFNGEYVVGFSWNKSGLSARCNCPAAEDAPICKHMVAAALFLLKDAEEKAALQGAEDEDQPATTAEKPKKEDRPRELEKAQRILRPGQFMQEILGWNQYYRQGELDKITPLEKQGEEGRWEFEYRAGKKLIHYPAIAYDHKDRFTLYCTCDTFGICAHTKAAVAWLRNRYSDKYFTGFRNFDKEKAEIFRQLGIAPDDPIAAEMTFEADHYDRLMARLPEWLIPAQNVEHQLAKVSNQLGTALPAGPPSLESLSMPKEVEPGIVLLTKPTAVPLGLELIPLNVAKGKFSRLNWGNEAHMEELRRATDPEVFHALEGLSMEGLNRQLRHMNTHATLPADTNAIRYYSGVVAQLRNHYYKHLQQLWPWLSALPEGAVFTTDNARIAAQNATTVSLFPRPLQGSIALGEEGKYLALRIVWKTADGEAIAERLTPQAGMLLRGEKTWYLPATPKDLRLMETLPHGRLMLPKSALEQVLRTTIAQFSAEYDVEIAESLRPKTVQPPVTPLLRLTEVGRKHLALVPRFRYGNETFLYEAAPRPTLTKNADGALEEMVRDQAAEKAFADKIADLHPEFDSQRGRSFYTLPFAKALEQSWYQHTLAALENEGIEVTGIGELEHFRYNANPAEVRVTEGENKSAGSEIDWFDLLIEISFGDQQVKLKDVRRALLNGEAGVRLADGTIGLLPKDFVERYGPLLRLGTESKNGSLRVSKLHFTLIDELYDAALGADLRAELAEKKRRLENIESVATAPVPESIQAKLRPYQLAGYQWLQVLENLGWGGCLADDMGLGKTLQTITFLQWLQERYPGAQSLVVCPTSLIYNWQTELEKFAPNLRYHVHYGPARVWDKAAPPTADVILTTYGTVRSDIELLSSTQWQYVILDESQAIKNPEAQTTKAVQLLPARNRICLSGTPLQNNTFDLFAQFQFLNPGLLGSREFFRSEFANPIDKHGEEGPRAMLRKMLAPFMMRRTKAQVAPDLPDKTEMVLWCEMEDEQRAVYDEYRRYYRDKLLQRIDKEGMGSSAIQVLEALLRLRQLCDHPALVRNQSVTTSESVKIAELRREILENTGGKKVLVFSQFTEMLALIAADFDREGISFTYLDGSTPAAQRAEAVDRFQNDPSVQVFLISLKAGGVGLNLTAAEYVYLVDPWWNPAVEAQAIDRTHRIGQQNKIVAYRMICKDTVEEKVMQLQARKKALADGLVTEDAGFVKKLTRDDVAFLLE